MSESKIVTAVGISVNSGDADLSRRLEEAMAAEILQCNEEGISTEEKNSGIIKERMMQARERVMEEIRNGNANG